jgi:hypothetical protein
MFCISEMLSDEILFPPEMNPIMDGACVTGSRIHQLNKLKKDSYPSRPISDPVKTHIVNIDELIKSPWEKFSAGRKSELR